MLNLNFFTAVTYQTPPKSIAAYLLQKVDDYFYLGGKKAYVIQGRTKTGQEKVILSEATSSLLAKVAKVLSFFTLVIPMILLMAKAALRSQHSFKLIDPKKKLEKGMNVSEDTIAKIKRLMPKIFGVQQDKEIEWLSTGNNLVFKLADRTNCVFKIAKPNHFHGRDKLPTGGNESTNARYENMVKAKEVCVMSGLNLLVVPHAKKFIVQADGYDFTFIAEECLNFDSNESAHEELYHKYSKDLNETARQLAIFVAKTGFNDVAWRNIPIITEAAGFQGPRRVALIDIEHMKSSFEGFMGSVGWGGNGSRGLIGCVSEEQIDAVIGEARKQGVITEKQAKEAKAQRLKELEENRGLRSFYAHKGIVTGKEPIQVDLNSLGLDLTEKGEISVMVGVENDQIKWGKKTVTLRKVAEDIVAEINKLIQQGKDQASIKGKRYFVLDTNNKPVQSYNYLGLSSVKMCISEEEEKQLWLRRVIQALIDKGHLFKLDKVNGHGYFIQA